MTTTNEMVAAGEMKMNGGFGKFHAATPNHSAAGFATVCGAPVFASAAMVESLSHVTCSRCLKKLGREGLH